MNIPPQCKLTSHVIFYFWGESRGGEGVKGWLQRDRGYKWEERDWERERESLLTGNTDFKLLVLNGVFFVVIVHITGKSDMIVHVQINVQRVNHFKYVSVEMQRFSV